MGGPIVRTGTTPEFWSNWDQVFGDKKTDKKTVAKKKATKKKTVAKAGAKKKKAAKKKTSKKSK